MSSNDLVLFEQEAIQMIIDYKWDTYCVSFFLKKFLIFSVYINCFYLDLESIHIDSEDGLRVKDSSFVVRKIIGISVQIFFLIYELI